MLLTLIAKFLVAVKRSLVPGRLCAVIVQHKGDISISECVRYCWVTHQCNMLKYKTFVLVTVL